MGADENGDRRVVPTVPRATVRHAVDEATGRSGAGGAAHSDSTAVYVIDRDWCVTFSHDADGLLRTGADAAAPGDIAATPDSSVWSLDPALAHDARGALLLGVAGRAEAASITWRSDRLDTWVELTAYPSASGVALHLRSVDSEREAHARLSSVEGRLERKAALLDIARDAIFVLDGGYRVTYWNRAAEALYGWSQQEAIGLDARARLHVDQSAFDAALTHLSTSGKWSGPLDQVTCEGRQFVADCRWQLTPADAADESPEVFLLCVVSDITEQRKEQEELYRTQRMDSLGTLAGGIAHDLNNVLTPILISSQLLLSEEHDDEKLQLLKFIETSAGRGSDMVQQVLAFVRGDESPRTLLDLRLSIDQLIAFCRETVPRSIDVDASVSSDLWPVLGDATQVLQILMNLVTNAMDAMPDGGRLTIGASNRRADPAAGAGVTDDVVIEVEDTGHGMHEDVAARVFEPFFTTKEAGRGTGLGLSTSLTIAQSHGGSMSVTSTPGAGSTFRLVLPAVAGLDRDAPEDASPRPEPTHRGVGQLVLVVDDEATIRMIVKHALESQGYSTLVAGDGVEAIMALENSDTPVDAVFTDMMMPVMDGAALATYLFEHHPGIALIASSGVSQKGDDAKAAHVGVEHFLPKPFSTDALLDALKEALASRGRPEA